GNKLPGMVVYYLIQQLPQRLSAQFPRATGRFTRRFRASDRDPERHKRAESRRSREPGSGTTAYSRSRDRCGGAAGRIPLGLASRRCRGNELRRCRPSVKRTDRYGKIESFSRPRAFTRGTTRLRPRVWNKTVLTPMGTKLNSESECRMREHRHQRLTPSSAGGRAEP